MSVNVSGVPSKTAKPTQDGRVVGGFSARIEDHPHQVNLFIFVELIYFLDVPKYKRIQD